MASAAATIAGVLSGLPITVAEAETVGDDYVRAESEPNKNTSKGSSSDVAAALAKAEETDEPAEVVSQREVDSQVFANPDGTMTRETAQGPIFADEGGTLTPIDPDLEPSGSRLEPKVVSQDTSFSATGDGVTAQVESEANQKISLTSLADLGTPEVDGGVATYPVTGNGDESVRVSTTASGFATHVLLASKPETAPVYRFRVDAPGLDVSIDERQLTFRSGNDVVAQSKPLNMWDADIDAAGAPEFPVPVAATLVDQDGMKVLELRPSMEWLGAAERRYPVTVDPDIGLQDTYDVQSDTYVFSDQASSDERGSDVNLRVGSPGSNRKFQSIVYLRYQQFVGFTVTDATLALRQYQNGAANCQAKTMHGRPMSSGDVYGPTWETKPEYSTDARFLTSHTFNFGSDCGAGTANLDVTPSFNAWAGGQQTGDVEPFSRNRQAVVLMAPNETDTTQEKRFCSIDWDSSSFHCGGPSVMPRISVTYEPELGSQSWYSMTDHTLDDRSSLSINNRSGNAVVSAQDATVKGVGQDLTISRTYNSMTRVTDTALGRGWNLGLGPDVWIERTQSDSTLRYDYHGPSGTVLGSFLRKSTSVGDADYRQFLSPIGGVGADLEQNSDGSLVLKFRKSPLRYEFAKMVGGKAYLTMIRDRSGNKIEFTYASGGSGRPQLTQIKDTRGRTYTVTYASGRLTKITQDDTSDGSTQREWSYGYDSSGQLTSFTDATGAQTSYGYSGGYLTSITGPGTASERSETSIAYRTNPKRGAVVGETTSVSYRQGNEAAADRPTFSWDYTDTRPDGCPTESRTYTKVTDPNQNVTTYCFAPRGLSGAKKKVWVKDAEGNTRSMDYTADNGPSAVTDGMGATTTSTYSSTDGQFSDRLTKTTQPRNTGSGNDLSTGLGYTGSSGENAYLPTTARESSNDCNRYSYDAKGRTTASYNGITLNAQGSCDAQSTRQAEFHRDYDDATGNVTASWDGNAPASPTNADKTLYSYWQSGQTGYVTGTTNLLKEVQKPGGSCDSPRKWCTSYTYDGWGRIATMTDGRGKVTRYEYDKNDRQLGVFYDGTAPSACTGSSATCLRYTYDAAGNVRTRSNGLEQTTMTYDRMNRLVEQRMPTGTVGVVDKVSMGYDGVGNMTSYNQEIGGGGAQMVTYTYDKANAPKTVTENNETVTITTDKNGRTDNVIFPSPAGGVGVKLDYDFAKNGQPAALKMNYAAGNETGRINYSYRIDGSTDDSSQLQERDVVTSSFADQRGVVTYKYKYQRLESADDTNGPSYAYTYDRVGNLRQEVAGATTTNFGYNRAGMLCWKGSATGVTSAPGETGQECSPTPSGNTQFRNDAAGNSEGSTSDPYVVNERNQVATVDGRNQTYLDQGNDLRRDNGAVRNIESSLGVTAQRSGSATTFFLRDPNGTILSSRTGSTRVNYVSEASGHVVWLVAPDGTQVGGYKYAPYGKTAAYGSAAQTNRFRWLGAQQNITSSGTDGHYKLGARYYDLQGHFTQPDPLSGGMSDPRTLTGYNYAGSDPINQTDSTGRSFEGFLDGAGKFLDGIDLAGNCLGIGQKATLTGCGDTILTVGTAAIVGSACTATAPACLLYGGVAGAASGYILDQAEEYRKG